MFRLFSPETRIFFLLGPTMTNLVCYPLPHQGETEWWHCFKPEYFLKLGTQRRHNFERDGRWSFFVFSTLIPWEIIWIPDCQFVGAIRQSEETFYYKVHIIVAGRDCWHVLRGDCTLASINNMNSTQFNCLMFSSICYGHIIQMVRKFLPWSVWGDVSGWGVRVARTRHTCQ